MQALNNLILYANLLCNFKFSMQTLNNLMLPVFGYF